MFEHPVIADLGGEPGPEVLKAGITLNAVLNLALLPGQNLPYNHVLQAWTGGSGESLPDYPQAIEDYQYSDQPGGRRRLRRPRNGGDRRHRPLPDPQHQRDRGRGLGVAEVHRRLEHRRPGGRRRRRLTASSRSRP